jgi:hypothetical protein
MATALNINQLKAQLTYGGARTNLFTVQITPPSGLTSFNSSKATFLITASKLPEVEMGQIEVPYMGRKLRLPGDRTFPAWNVTVINDEDFMVRNGMEEWISKINGTASNLRDSAFGTTASFKNATATVTQLNKRGENLRSYTFQGLYPASISSIDLDWAQNDQIEYFNISFMYDYWTVAGGTNAPAYTIGNTPAQ